MKAIERATGKRPIGFHAPAMRATPPTLGIFEDLDFLYHTGDLSGNEPFLIPVPRKLLAAAPYTFAGNDFENFENRWRACSDFAGALKAAFDAPHLESDRRRASGAAFMRKDEIGRSALSSPMRVREDEFA